MANEILLYFGAALPAVWGIAHVIPTKSVVAGFGDISPDNRHIVIMEWIGEGIALVFVGVMVTSVTLAGAKGFVSEVVLLISAVELVVFAVVSLFTGFRIPFLPFRLCPVVFLTSALLIVLGVVL